MTYNVFRGTTAGAEGAQPINAAPIASLTFTDSTVAMGNTYFYVVQGVETCGTFVLTSAKSNEVSATFPTNPSAPTLQTPVLN